MMLFGFIGINYKNAALDVRGRTAFTDTEKMEFLQKAEALGIFQCMILATCNRSEVYFFCENQAQGNKVKELYLETFNDAEIERCLNQLWGDEAVSYLFRITAGLESLVLGEDQILGQVKEALDFSKTLGFTGKELTKIVRDAVTCAKKIKTELHISEKPLSVSYIGIRELEKCCGIQGRKVLIIGSGKTASLAMRYVFDYQAAEVTACSRTYAHASELKSEFPNIDVIDYTERYTYMKSCDIVISATSSPHLVVKKDKLDGVGDITFLDLAAPRDIDPAIGCMENMKLINLDTLQKIAEENKLERRRLVEQSHGIIEGAVAEASAWLKSSKMDSTIESLQLRCSEIVDDSFNYLNRKLDLSAREQKILRKMLNASLQRLLREPIHELRQLDEEGQQEEYRRMVHKLFQI
jgi:glutamyl-tRNA reductase